MNEHCLTNLSPELPDDKETRLIAHYACPTNLERNAISASIFKEHIKATHLILGSQADPPLPVLALSL